MNGPLTVVVGVDGSSAAASALQWSADLVRMVGGEVVAVHALGLLSHLPAGEPPVTGAGATSADGGGQRAPAPPASAAERRAQVESQVHRWAAPLQAAGVVHRCLVVDGNPVIALLQAATGAGADLIVVGRRGSGGFPGLLLGSTSHELTAHARMPVVVVPGPAETAGN